MGLTDSVAQAAPTSVEVPTRRWLVVAAVAVAVLVLVYLLAVCTSTGQQLENAALRGADQAGDPSRSAADSGLARITVYSLAASVVLIAAIGLVRRRLDLTAAAVGVIVVGFGITQVLKRFVLPRPALVPVVGPYTGNSLPSGHTTIAMTVLFAALVVVPYRWRGVATFLVMFWAVSIGGYTVTAKWHRLSDTLAADAVALAVACVASWWLARRGAIRVHQGRGGRPRVVLVVLAAVFGFGMLVIGAVLVTANLVRGGLAATVRDEAYVLYVSANSFAVAGSIAAALVFLWTWRRLEIS